MRQVAEGRETAKGEMDQSGVRTNMQHLVSVASKFAKTKNLHAKVGHEKKERRRKAKRGIDAVLGFVDEEAVGCWLASSLMPPGRGKRTGTATV